MPHTASLLLSRLGRLVAADGYAHGLKPVQLQALRFLARANRFTRTPRGLTAWLGQTKGTVSQTIAALERRGLLARSGDARDRRIVRLELTDAGHALAAAPDDISGSLVARLPEADLAGFAAMLQTMLQGHLAERRQRPMGICHTCRHFERHAAPGALHRCALLDVVLDDVDAKSICIEQEAA